MRQFFEKNLCVNRRMIPNHSRQIRNKHQVGEFSDEELWLHGMYHLVALPVIWTMPWYLCCFLLHTGPYSIIKQHIPTAAFQALADSDWNSPEMLQGRDAFLKEFLSVGSFSRSWRQNVLVWQPRMKAGMLLCQTHTVIHAQKPAHGYFWKRMKNICAICRFSRHGASILSSSGLLSSAEHHGLKQQRQNNGGKKRKN